MLVSGEPPPARNAPGAVAASLAEMRASCEFCAYPECPLHPREDLDLCKQSHSAKWPGNRRTAPDDMMSPNDGIVDWMAVEIAVHGWRYIKMTWVERDIATVLILALLQDDPEFTGNRYHEAAIRTCTPVDDEQDPSLRGARFRRLALISRRQYGDLRAA